VTSNLNLPNTITMVRIFIAPLCFWLLLTDAGRDGAQRWLAVVLFVTAILTDGLDGYIARSRGLVTDLGKILDPIADKLLTSGALVCLSILGELPWLITAIVIVREVGITVWRFFELRRGRVLPATSGGKTKTVVQAIAITFALAPLWHVLGDWISGVNTGLMMVAVILTVWSGAQYLRDAARQGRG